MPIYHFIFSCSSNDPLVAFYWLYLTNQGLEASDRSLKWVIKSSERAQEVEKWLLESRFEDRVKDSGLIIRDWAPQVLILAHPSVGGFLTLSGWRVLILYSWVI